ncbi:MAG: glycoside hydrolase family 3 C-terminal domain-containing protein [Ancrocorticia sp.]|nr:glycoside hydrolase family 3 C-terminal domain-containing protein [Ancrocorticia sp.]MCI1896127.1 glycoside hydrolase family 3 C-terminal domain-containing protein [Ancrocorticia sp.]MCI1932592.1 glycoside hydrolase family 3 C-terminal domain-containing protein [Ancrocorticia sp.]MCI1962549.1 glycoside hydrolase family 3 C-terminal domain-containing protein [Ancrocorticia sp.]MCI2002521.1 glycoside hydrolase family 3 C-terminal domain-containing protein [Ancrocorticia sp.]
MPVLLPYQNPELPVAERVADVLSRMSLEEKVGQMLQVDARGDLAGAVLGRHVGSILHTSPEKVLEAHRLTDQTRLQIPLLVADDCIHGHSFWPGATIFPTQLGMAASWDADLLERVGRAAACEVAATGIHWTFSPVLCIARDLRWGRVDETFGEDPFLIGELATAMMRGYQGDGLDDPTAILATAKHFAGYSETQGGRDASEADISRRKLRSWFLPPFEKIAKAGVGSFMLGYQSIDGVPVTLNEWLLTDVLRGEWGYTGVLVTDWDNVGRMVWEQKVQPDIVHAAAAAVKAGNEMIMTTPTFYEGALEAVRRGMITESDIDRAVRHILAVKFQMGLFENRRRPTTDAAIGTPEHRALNLEVARRSVVLLKNDGALPLAPGTRRIAVVGPLADDAQTQLGDWAGSSGQVEWMKDGQPRAMITTLLDGFRRFSPANCEVSYAQGATILHLEPDPEGTTFADGQPRPPIVVPDQPDPRMIAEAVECAKSADVVVAAVGDRIEVVGEARSTATLELLGGQKALLDALIATGKPVIVVLLASKPLVLPECVDRAAGLVWAANPGMEGGRAIAEIIWGIVNPTGRLPISLPVHVGQQPCYYNQIRGQHGHRYADLTQHPAYAFGFGLSYTQVEYSNARVERPTVGRNGVVRAHVTCTNKGTRPTLETVQAYISDRMTSASWADKELKAYRQVELEPGESREVEMVIPVAECSIVNAQGRRVVEPGEFTVALGSSSQSADLLPVAFTVE